MIRTDVNALQTVPSSKAWFGASQGGATARIQGNCKPKQWVPREW